MVCCFSGHREIADSHIPFLRQRLHDEIKRQVSDGTTEFRTGGAVGFDTLAALCVLEEKEQHPNIKLRVFVPHPFQSKNFTKEEKERYYEILERADEAVLVSPSYFRGCMAVRNRALVDGSDCCIAYLTAATGGTKMTVNYARKKGLKIINLGELK